jgi:hypothetical protein
MRISNSEFFNVPHSLKQPTRNWSPLVTPFLMTYEHHCGRLMGSPASFWKSMVINMTLKGNAF